MQYFSKQYGDMRGRLTFNGRFTGETMADMLLGWAEQLRRQLDAAGPYHLVSNYSGYVQDDFKVCLHSDAESGPALRADEAAAREVRRLVDVHSRARQSR